MNKVSGVYKITNTITGDFYIGSSKNICERWTNHKKSSTWTHVNSKLYQAFAKYGIDKFTFEVIEETTNLKEREQYWIAKLNPSYNSIRAKRTRNEQLDQMKYWHRSHRTEVLSYKKEYYKSHIEEQRSKQNDYNNRLCLYEGNTIKFGSLVRRFHKQGIEHPCIEAKKYLL